MATACAAPLARQEPASCSGRGLSQLTCRRQPPLRVFGRRAAAAVRCAALADNEAYEDEQQEWGQTTKVFDFTYMSAEEAAAEEAASAAAWRQGMDEYAALQEWLLFRTWRFGLLFAGYLLLAASGEAAFCELAGAAVGYGYLKLLIADVSRLQPGDRIPMREAEALQSPMARWPAKLAAGYRQALQPRLLVLPGLLAAVAAWDAAFPELQLGLVEQGCLLGGFLSYKVALALKIYEDLKPKPMTEEDLLRQSRPSLVEVEDVAINLREIGRKKAAEAEAAAAAAAAAEAAPGGTVAPGPGQQQPSA